MLERIHPAEIILALKPLLINTPRSPRTDKTPKHILTPQDVTDYLRDVVSRMTGCTCPECKQEWNNLTPEGVCIACLDRRGADARRELELGAMLQKTIGKFGTDRYRFDNYETDGGNMVAWEAMKNFDPAKDNVYLYGPCGTGKTHLAGAVLKQCAGNNITAKWINPVYMAMVLQGKFPSEHLAYIEDLANYDLLVIDDLGAGDELKQTLKALYFITDKRKAQNKNGLIVTSNLSMQDLQDRLKDDRITSRIAGLCRVIQVIGDDRRIERSQ